MRRLNYLPLLGSCVLMWWTAPRAWSQANPVPIRHPAPAAAVPSGTGTLVFDADLKQYDAKPGEMTAPFLFSLTNVGTTELVIEKVKPSCGCTTAKLPPVPWHIPPGGTGEVEANVNLAGKMGLISKTLTFTTSAGTHILTLKVKIPPAVAGSVPLTGAERQMAMAKAASEPMAIFKGDCASCHVQKGAKAFGEELYVADCGICHESPQRASSVPDLHALKQKTDLAYWKENITLGKPHTMMPPFASSHGGPLSDAQIDSLATYLNRTISHNFGQLTNAAIAAPIRSAALP
ncbi:MAG TPA: DUF1573 domain-containing protein [Candidatus Saccharimonadales bacterium]|nr:DUF1573 domain-containing protein [Candidatus Saccharimonadales bacterium]